MTANEVCVDRQWWDALTDFADAVRRGMTFGWSVDAWDLVPVAEARLAQVARGEIASAPPDAERAEGAGG